MGIEAPPLIGSRLSQLREKNGFQRPRQLPSHRTRGVQRRSRFLREELLTVCLLAIFIAGAFESARARARSASSVRSRRNGVIETQLCSTAQRSVPFAAPSSGVTVNQKIERPIGSCQERPCHRNGVQIGESTECLSVFAADSHLPKITFWFPIADPGLWRYKAQALKNPARDCR